MRGRLSGRPFLFYVFLFGDVNCSASRYAKGQPHGGGENDKTAVKVGISPPLHAVFPLHSLSPCLPLFLPTFAFNFRPAEGRIASPTFMVIYTRAPLKTPSEKKQLCTASAASIPLVVRKHAFEGFPCTYCTYLFFLAQNGFLEMPLYL